MTNLADLGRHVGPAGVPGLVAAVSRRGGTHVTTLGDLDRDRGAPVARGSIFRVSSMTKPVTAAAAMILVEECVLRLDDPLDDLLPELADRRVLTRLDAPLHDTVPARRPITLRDLLTFRLGFGMLLVDPDEYPIAGAAWRLPGMGPPAPAATPAPDVRLLGALMTECLDDRVPR